MKKFILKSFALMFIAIFITQVVAFSIASMTSTEVEGIWNLQDMLLVSLFIGIINTWVPYFVLTFMGEKK